MSLEIKPATRQGVKALVGIYGKSGGGKTLTALFLARGLAGPKGRVTLIDTESGRGSIFADIVPEGYQVIELDAPFSAQAYTDAIELAEKNSDAVVVDSMSHEWSGEGGVLDQQEAELDRMAGDNWGKREACKMAAWIKPKQAHKKFIMRLLRLRCPLICCLRGEEKTHIAKGAPGEKNKVVTDEFSSPLFDPRFIFEMLINFECIARKNDQTGLMEGGFVIPRKITHPSVAPLLPRENEQLGIKFGEALAAWCRAAGNPTPQPTAHKPDRELTALKKELWKITKAKHDEDKARFRQWLTDECDLAPDKLPEDLTVPELENLIVKAKTKL